MTREACGSTVANNLAEGWTRATGVEALVFYANWAALGRSAGPICNQQMLDERRPDTARFNVRFCGGGCAI